MSEQILIVDDTKSTRMLLTALLEESYQIRQAESGEQCLTMIKNQRPDLVVLDVNMPGISGYEVCTELRKNERTLHLPVIFVSGLDSPEERLAGLKAGGNEYIIKPIDPDRLNKKIAQLIEQQK